MGLGGRRARSKAGGWESDRSPRVAASPTATSIDDDRAGFADSERFQLSGHRP